MIFDLIQINEKYPIKGVIHVGAFAGEELDLYRKLGLCNTMMFEPQEDLYNLIKSRCIFSEKIHNVALGSESCTKEMYISFREGGVSQGCGASSSLLKPKKHLEEHPEVTFTADHLQIATKVTTGIAFTRMEKFATVSLFSLST